MKYIELNFICYLNLNYDLQVAKYACSLYILMFL